MRVPDYEVGIVAGMQVADSVGEAEGEGGDAGYGLEGQVGGEVECVGCLGLESGGC